MGRRIGGYGAPSCSARRRPTRCGTQRRSVGGEDVDDLAPLALAELDRAVSGREERVVATDADVAARVNLGAALADDDGASGDLRAVEHLDAQALGVGVATVAG